MADETTRKTSHTLDEAARAVLEDLRAGRPVKDPDLDRIYPDDIRALSSKFWTPVNVAREAARLLLPEGKGRVLDVGAGVGRFCLVGALTTEGEFIGVEHRLSLVEVGREVFAAAGATRAGLIHGTPEDVDFADYDGLFFYAPFEENLFEGDWNIDHSVHLSADRFRDDVARTEAALVAAPVGLRVVTYQGFGGTMPASFKLIEEAAHGYLRAWLKIEEGAAGGAGTPDVRLLQG